MNKFNRILLASGLAATASLVANSPAFAQATGTINLSGNIPYSLSLTLNGVTPGDTNTTLSLNPGQTYAAVKIGTISAATSNSPNGLRVSVSSNWTLTSSTGGIIAISSFGETSNIDMNGSRVEKTPPPSTFDLTYTTSSAAGNAPHSGFFITYTVPTSAPPGNYAAAILFAAIDK
jgi:hypothetical protein